MLACVITLLPYDFNVVYYLSRRTIGSRDYNKSLLGSLRCV